jgi:hypothetical protein
MKRRPCIIGWVVLLLSFSGPVLAQTKDPWLHLEVHERSSDPALVKVNLPISMVDVALDIVKDEKFRHGRFRLDTDEISIAEMRRIWSELRKAGDGEFVSVEKKTETVRIARQGNLLLVKVTGPDKQKAKVDLKVPITVVDALLEGSGDELNLKAALMAMQQRSSGDILTVNDEQTQVRLWID